MPQRPQGLRLLKRPKNKTCLSVCLINGKGMTIVIQLSLESFISCDSLSDFLEIHVCRNTFMKVSW